MALEYINNKNNNNLNEKKKSINKIKPSLGIHATN